MQYRIINRRAAFYDRLHQGHQARLQLTVHRLDLCSRCSRLILVQQRVVEAVLVAQVPGGAAGQLQHLLQPRGESRIVDRRARFRPHLLCDGARAGHLLDQLGRKLHRLVIVPANHAHESRVVALLPLACDIPFCLLDETPGLVRRQHLVRELREGSELLRPPVGPRGRHIGLLIPAQECSRAFQIADLRQPGPQFSHRCRLICHSSLQRSETLRVE